MKSTRIIPCLCAALAFSGATELKLNSQVTESSAQKSADRPAPALGAQGMFMAGLGPIASVLTDAQRASFRQAMEAHHESLRPIETRLRDARKKMIESELAVPFDESAVRAQALAVATIEAEFSVIRARALSEVQPPLSQEQITKIKNGAAAPLRNADGFRTGGERKHHLTSTNRDENDLPRN
jgi:Spy/CpxP family protein refolding chaperone